MSWILTWLAATVVAFVVAMSICKAAADSDKRML